MLSMAHPLPASGRRVGRLDDGREGVAAEMPPPEQLFHHGIDRLPVLAYRQDGAFVEVEAQVRLAISNDAGKMIAFVSGGAKMQVPRRGYDATYLPQLRRDAIENAVRGLFTKLIDQLRRSLTS